MGWQFDRTMVECSNTHGMVRLWTAYWYMYNRSTLREQGLIVVRAEFCSRPFRQSVQSLVIFCLDNLLFVVAVAVTFNRDVYILYILLGV